MEVGGVRLFLCFCCLILLKICESWILSSSSDFQSQNPEYTKIVLPLVTHPRCDACRFIALVIDTNLRAADDRLEGEEELRLSEVESIAQDICSKHFYRDVSLNVWDGVERLSAPFLETWKVGVKVDTHKDWTAKVASHCRYLLDKMKGMELYDLWLRTGHRDPESWIEFLCDGEGVFGDCIMEDDGSDWPWEIHTHSDSKEINLPLEDLAAHRRNGKVYLK